jgi:CheY-like chemotaxis protein
VTSAGYRSWNLPSCSFVSTRSRNCLENRLVNFLSKDVAMPEVDGEVAARIQSDPALHRIPIVFLTALVTKAEGKSGLRIQGHPFLAKPISLPELIKGIEENLPAHAAL